MKTSIIETLARVPSVSAEELLALIEPKRGRYSRRAIFKELKALEEEGVVYRSKGVYSLQMLWVINMASLFHDAFLTLITKSKAEGNSTDGNKPPVAPQKMEFQNLARLDYSWMQIMLLLTRHYPGEPVMVFKPEHWFYLVHENVTSLFLSAMSQVHTQSIHVIGNDCFVNRRGASKIVGKKSQVIFKRDLFGLGDATYLTLIGEYLLTVKLAAAKATEMRELFSEISSEKELKDPRVGAFMHGAVRSTLKIEYKPRRIGDYRERFLTAST